MKIAIAARRFLGLALAAMFSAHGKIISNNAVIATNLVSLRTPIDGPVSGVPDRAGVMVAKGALIAHIENPRVTPAGPVPGTAKLSFGKTYFAQL